MTAPRTLSPFTFNRERRQAAGSNPRRAAASGSPDQRDAAMTAPFHLDVDPASIERVATAAPHYRPILEAVRQGQCGLMLVPQGPEPFSLPASGRPVVAIIGDDPPLPGDARGPAGFHLGSVKKLLGSADCLAFVSCEPPPFVYIAAATSVVMGPGIVGARPVAVIVESRENREGAWLKILRRYRPAFPPILALVKKEPAA